MKGDRLVIKEEHVRAASSLANILLPYIKKSKKVFVISIAGESGSGKSEIASVCAQKFDERDDVKSIIIQQDDYFVYPPKTNAKMRRKNIGHVGFSEVHLELLDQHLAQILKGEKKIKKPLVIFNENRITDETIDLRGIKVVIVEGTYTTVLKNVHQHIFIDRTFIDTIQSRRQRSREKQDKFLEKILEIEHNIISAHKPRADIIITPSYGVKKL
jgi:uridine kinase